MLELNKCTGYSMPHEFGGPWTEEKLRILRDYLRAYLAIFHGNERARYFTTHYVDAFAGTGSRSEGDASDPTLPLLEVETDADALDFKAGSATIALDLMPPFDHYLFIERRQKHVAELRAAVEREDRSVTVKQGEANELLRAWIDQMEWDRNRAVVFLDPYGMQVEWETIERLARTEAVDLWLLFPLGQGVIRLLTEAPPSGAWADRLTVFFGNEDWKTRFYRIPQQLPMFGAARPERDVKWESIERYFVERLKSVFPGVAPKPRRLYNSTNSIPLYLLFFASANPRGAPTAIKIAKHILEKV